MTPKLLHQRPSARYGWRPDTPDQRDKLFAPKAIKMPPVVDLHSRCPAVYDQGNLGSCTANALCNAFRFALQKEAPLGAPEFEPSRLFLYYRERVLEGTVGSDAGAEIRDGAKVLRNIGVCSEGLWPYDPASFAKAPPPAGLVEAKRHESIDYRRVDLTYASMRACLAEGYPFVVGITVYESFESAAVAKSGKVPMPRKKEASVGGHAVLVVGYSDKTRRWLLQNSWGEDWGVGGFFSLPYAYLVNEDLAADAWTIRSVER